MLTQKPVSPYLFVLTRLRWKNEWKISSWKLERKRKNKFWDWSCLQLKLSSSGGKNHHISAEMFRVNWLVKDVDQMTVLEELRKLSMEIVIAKTFFLLSFGKRWNIQQTILIFWEICFEIISKFIWIYNEMNLLFSIICYKLFDVSSRP